MICLFTLNLTAAFSYPRQVPYNFNFIQHEFSELATFKLHIPCNGQGFIVVSSYSSHRVEILSFYLEVVTEPSKISYNFDSGSEQH